MAKECRDRADNSEKINFARALKMIGPNMDLDEPLYKEWIITSDAS